MNILPTVLMKFFFTGSAVLSCFVPPIFPIDLTALSLIGFLVTMHHEYHCHEAIKDNFINNRSDLVVDRDINSLFFEQRGSTGTKALEMIIYNLKNSYYTLNLKHVDYRYSKLISFITPELHYQKIKLIVERNKNNLNTAVNAILDNKDLILSNNFYKVLNNKNIVFDTLNAAIKNSLFFPQIVINKLLTGEIKDKKIDRYISNEDADQILAKLDQFINENLFYLAGVCNNFTICNDVNPKYIPNEILANIASWMTREDKYSLLENLICNNDVPDKTQEINSDLIGVE